MANATDLLAALKVLVQSIDDGTFATLDRTAVGVVSVDDLRDLAVQIDGLMLTLRMAAQDAGTPTA